MEGVTDPIKHMKTIELLNLTYAVSTNKRLDPLQRKLSAKFTNHVKIHTVPIPNYLLNDQNNDSSVNNSLPGNGNGNGNGSEEKLWCDHCKILLIPGLNLQVRVKYLKDKTKVKSQKKTQQQTQQNQDQDEKKKKGKDEKSNGIFRKRVLSYKCLDCDKEMIFDELMQPKPENIEIKETERRGREAFKLNTLPNLQFKSSNSQFPPDPNPNTTSKLSSVKSGANTPDKSDTDSRKNDNFKNASSKSRSKKRKQMNSLTSLLKEKKKKQEESNNKGLDLMGFMKL
ncbi:hypothetical protein BVG19_g3553 [[Candida] boidinii]|nr:hypothetical protein BVG19_g3553 [[Candida] boidinii]OWB48948.1 hypothetical protein B5S27_g486 [[Candida] boidinii]